MMRVLRGYRIRYSNNSSVWALLLLFLLASCTVDSFNEESSPITEADLLATGQIVGESLSEQNDAILTSLTDALSTPTTTGFQEIPFDFLKIDSLDNSLIGSEDDYTYQFNAGIGTHNITFSRNVNLSGFTKSISADLTYTYYDIEDNIVQDPDKNRELIETVEFLGKRNGTVTTANKVSSFERTDQLLIFGLSGSNTILEIDGIHSGEGTFETIDSTGAGIQRTYSMIIDFLDINIDKTLAEQNGDLSEGVTGALAYEIVIERINNGSSGVQTINGTINFTGDGTALLKFARSGDVARINLDDGDLFEEDEFEGTVTSVNLGDSFFTMANGQRLLIDEKTDIDESGDLFTLSSVKEALAGEKKVEASGTFIRENDSDLFTVRAVRFESEQDNEESDTDFFEGTVTGIDVENGTITIGEELVLSINEQTVFDDSGDILSLQGLEEAINLQLLVRSRGKVRRDENDRLIVDKILLKYSFENLQGSVTAVNEGLKTVRLDTNGDTIYQFLVTNSTEFSTEGDILSFANLTQRVVEQNLKVQAKVEGPVTLSSAENDLIAFHLFLSLTLEDFEGDVSGVDLENNTYNVSDNTIVNVNSETLFKEGSDLNSLTGLADARQQGKVVTSIGHGAAVNNSDSEQLSLLAFEAKLLYKKEGYEGLVTAVDTNLGTFTVDDQLLIKVDENSVFSSGSQFASLQEVKDAIDGGNEVFSSGNGIVMDDTADFELTAIKISFDQQ